MENVYQPGVNPGQRFGHSVSLINQRFAVVFGGAIPNPDQNYLITNDLFIYDCLQERWSKVRLKDAPSQRAAHSSCQVEELQMVIFGGASGNGKHTDNNLYLLRNIGEEAMKWIIVPVEGKSLKIKILRKKAKKKIWSYNCLF